MITFGLTRSARVVFDVFGPGPSCALAGRVPVAGKKGVNRLRFDGTVRKVVRETVQEITVESVQDVTLAPGMYKLELNSRGGKRRLAQTFVTVVDPSSPRKTYPSPDCSPDTVQLSTFAALVTTGASGEEPVASGSVEPVGTVQSVPTPEDTDAATESDESVVQGEVNRQGLGVPVDESRSTFETLVLALLLGLLAALVAAAVYGAMRRRWPLT